ncbi:MAG: M20/M25/M40 family metallo-hydrolase [Gemmatimonadetes bacterium]|nr:M20/M25/M40 family metallo-hydrolase [Gemmatimonadota bacterium]MBI2537730.1 M20/M25/M40 family metallo-hydrolase [Gemmatimonadota bacterium]
MRTRILFITFAAALAAGRLPAQSATERVARDLRYLADDRREGRGIGTAGLDSASGYLAVVFAAIGLRPAGEDGFFQPFTVDSSTPAAAHAGVGGARTRNVVGLLPGSGALSNEVVVIGAHYDHLGKSVFGSLDPDSVGVVHNGADDNASGTTALLEIARRLKARQARSARTIVFVAFSGEELGLLGSTYYVKHPARPLSATYAMVNLDMVGRLGTRKLTVFGTETAKEFPALLDSVAGTYQIAITGTGDGYGRSDQESFYTQDIPVLHFFTGVHEDYHRTTDDWQKIDFPGLVKVAEVASDLAWRLATRTAPLTLVKAPPPPPVAGGGGYGAYLGTVPDMTESPGGVRLTGVRPGSPAEQAGLKGGDVLIQLGDTPIKNLYHMTDALRAHQPGETVVLVYVRDGQRIETKVTLGRRGG